ncbi:MAG TPA: ribosome rescue protein RqcH [Thermoplasmata archaeon]|nr:ribosome rescue protein RqcH [Thermoplasmata archaeon]
MAVRTEPTPKDRSTALDLLAVVREGRAVTGSRLDKAFDLDPRGVGLVFRGHRTRLELWLVPGLYAAWVPAGQEHAEGLSTFARELRRLASGASLAPIAEPAGERFLELELARASDPVRTVVGAELFGSGNLLLAREGRLVAVEKARRWAHRDVRPGAAYERPPQRADAFAATAAEIEAELARSRTDLASTLAARLALGGPVAEELVARAAWDGARPASPAAHELAPEVHRLLAALLGEVGERPAGYLVRRGDQVVDASPYRPRRWEGVPGVELEPRPTFSEAAVVFFGSLQPRAPSPEEAARRAERAGLERLVERQRGARAELAASIEDRRRDAEAVYAHYAHAEEALARAALERPTPRRVDVPLGERVVALATGGTAREAAQRLYEEAKRLAEKLEGASAALRATEERLAGFETERRPSPARPRTTARNRGPRWFEKFRWFVTSEGALVLGGRDAPSNDLLVRRHLKDGDLYFHADLHGAASVVLKRPTPPATATEASLREAAQWAVAFSKAWRAGLASGTAFWATPDQVSKSAGAGEFVARGAWVVRGTKHFVADVPLELGIGTVRYEGEELLSVAPPTALRARGEARFLLLPGDERERGEREVELARELGVPRSRLQGLLPAGGLTVRRA